MTNKKIKNILKKPCLKGLSLLLVFFFVAEFLFPFSIKADTYIEELNNKIQQKQNEIAELEKKAATFKNVIKQKKTEETTLANQIAILKNEIARLEAEIESTEGKISQTNLEIEKLIFQIDETEKKINREKGVLAELLRTIYEYDQESTLELLLKNNTFSDFLNHQEYLSITQIRLQGSLDEVKLLKDDLEKKKTEQESDKKALEDLKEKLDIQNISLAGQKENKDYLLNQTKGEEKKYQAMLSEAEKERAEFLAEIRELEKQVIARQNFFLHIKSGVIPPPGTKIFAWPEDDPILTQGYGMTAFAKRGAYGGAPHNGIDMSAGAGSPIKSIAPGEILAYGFSPRGEGGWGNWVAIKHAGNLVSLYAHMLKPTHLTQGTMVETGTVIGYEGSTGYSTGSHLHLSIYYDFFTYELNGRTHFNYFEGTLNPLDYL